MRKYLLLTKIAVAAISLWGRGIVFNGSRLSGNNPVH